MLENLEGLTEGVSRSFQITAAVSVGAELPVVVTAMMMVVVPVVSVVIDRQRRHLDLERYALNRLITCVFSAGNNDPHRLTGGFWR